MTMTTTDRSLIPIGEIFDGAERGACRGAPQGWFFLERGESSRHGKAMCNGMCTVQADCLEWALAHPAETKFGIWGGTTERDRRRMRSGRPTNTPAETAVLDLLRLSPQVWFDTNRMASRTEYTAATCGRAAVSLADGGEIVRRHHPGGRGRTSDYRAL